MLNSVFFLTPLLSSFLAVQAINEWSKPCFQGSCSYDMPQDSGIAGSLIINGSPDAISDITAAGGWLILECNKDKLEQEIRLVCTSDDPTTAGCDHLYQKNGAVGKIVRLPENCGRMAFARVARAWVHENQTMPASLVKQLSRRANQSSSQVQGLALDTNFAAVDPSKAGEITIAIEGATLPGAQGNATITPPAPISQRRSRLAQRRTASNFIETAFDKYNSFDKNAFNALPPINVNVDVPMFEVKASCPPLEASVKAGVKTKASTLITVGVAATGKLVPPKFDSFGLFAGLNGELDGTFSLAGSAEGTVERKVTIFQAGVPGLSFPGLLTIGPSFKIEAQAKALTDINIKTDINVNYKMNDVKMFFPSSKNHNSGGNFQPGNSPLKLSVSPSLASRGALEVHLVPRLDMGITALNGAAKATVFLTLDNSASMSLTLDASANASTTATPSKGKRSEMLLADSNLRSGDKEEETVHDECHAEAEIDCQNATEKGAEIEARAFTAGEASTSVNGCVKVGGAVNVNAGADGSFFNFFDAKTKVDIFSKEFDLFKKCVGTSTNKRSVSPDSRSLAAISKRALKCTATSGIPDLVTFSIK